jgi:hypothetical protein
MRLLAPWISAALLAGCLGSSPDDGGLGQDLGADAAGDGSGAHSDGGLPTPVDSGLIGNLDFSNADLTGLTNCYGATVCDPTSSFCIRFYNGSAAAPGTLGGGPACYEPSDTCGNQGQNMDCGCIQADPILGAECQGSCVDHMDGTYDCYAM